MYLDVNPYLCLGVASVAIRPSAECPPNPVEGRAEGVREILDVDWATLKDVHVPYVTRSGRD